ncbi:MAG: tyrosine--tRNA ligase [Bdellovibrionia bacterium]
MKATPQEQLKELKRGAVEILPEDELLRKLEESYKTRKPLIVKFGADPSRPDIHLGHTVVMNKLKTLQDFGHDVHFLIGDFTAQIGDPTGRNKTRQQLSAEEVKRNAETYQDQVFKILDPAKTKIVYNSTWLGKIHLARFLQTLMTTTVVQLLAREDFTERFKTEQPIYLHEFLYPILQGYDSVEMKADIELGGTDQKFNLLMGRHLQKSYGIQQQAVIIMPILEGLDGVNKMSKSLDNYISLTDSPKDIFGKIMSISDVLMLRYYDLLSNLTVSQIEQMKADLQAGTLHPMKVKKQLAEEIVTRFHGPGSGAEELQRFEELFSKKSLTTDLPLVEAQVDSEGRLNLIGFMTEQGFVKSKSDARRLLQQKAVKVDGEVVQEEWFQAQPGVEYVLRAGKLKMVKLRVAPKG